MKIVMVSPFFPYENVTHAGGKYIFELVRNLSKKHDIYLISRVEKDEEQHISSIRQYCKEIWTESFQTPKTKNTFNNFIIAASYYRLSKLTNKILKEYNFDFDIIQVEYIEVGLFLKTSPKTSFFMNAHDVISKPHERIYNQSKSVFEKIKNYILWKVVCRLEKHIISKFPYIFAKSEQDKEILLKLDNNYNIDVISHPVRVEATLDKSMNTDNTDKHSILFLGAMHREANIRSALYLYKEIFPKIKTQLPDIKLYIVGNRPPKEIIELGNDNNVIVTGFVDDIMEYYQKTSVFVAPIVIGGGIIVKNLDAMAIGSPVVTSSYGNEGIRAKSGRDLFVADDPDEFAKHVVKLVLDKKLRTDIVTNGHRFIIKNFSVEIIIKKIEKCYEKSLNISG